MKFFTPELYVSLQSSDPTMADKGDEAWENASVRYRRRLEHIARKLPRSARYIAKDLPLHDAEVLSLARENGKFVIVLRLDEPYGRTVILTYRLTADPKITESALPKRHASHDARWLYDEVDLAPGKRGIRHDILLSNGWEVLLQFKDVSIFEADALLPSPYTSELAGTAHD